jgi:hypothetical protein
VSEVELTPEDIKNGWTAETLRAYHAERDAAAIVHGGAPVGGLVVTEFSRASYRPPIRHESARDFNPHHWGRRRG